MAEAFLGEIRLFSGSYAPQDWHFCDGTLLTVNTYQALFSLIGTVYGGNGVTNFGLPDLRGRIPIGSGQGTGLTQHALGATGGTETVALTQAQLPAHTHALNASKTLATAVTPSPGVLLGTTPPNTGIYLNMNSPSGGSNEPMIGTAVQTTGGGQAHNNVMPCLALQYIICINNGYYPMRPN